MLILEEIFPIGWSNDQESLGFVIVTGKAYIISKKQSWEEEFKDPAFLELTHSRKAVGHL